MNVISAGCNSAMLGLALHPRGNKNYIFSAKIGISLGPIRPESGLIGHLACMPFIAAEKSQNKTSFTVNST